MRVLFVVSDSNCRGGTEILAYNLLKKLNDEGIYCRLISRYQYKGDNPFVLSFSSEDCARLQTQKSSVIDKLLGNKRYDTLFSKLVSQIAEELKVDWIINHTYDLIGAIPQIPGVRTAQIFNWSVVGYERDLYSLVNHQKWPVRFLAKIALWRSVSRWHNAAAKMTKLIALTNSARKELLGMHTNIRSHQIAVIPNPLMYSSESKSVSSLNNRRVVFVGRLSHEKGVMRLLRIWKQLNRQIHNYELCIYGEGDMQDEMEKYISEHSIKGIYFKGFCNNIEDIYSNADLCCVTSDTEGFGMVLIEAMYYGVPCLSFDCPVSPKEIIAKGGDTVPCFDEDSYVNRIIDILSDFDLRHAMQNAAISRAKDFYINKVVKMWIDLLNEK